MTHESDTNQKLITVLRGIVHGLLKFPHADRKLNIILTHLGSDDLQDLIFKGNLTEDEVNIAERIEKAIEDIINYHDLTK